MSGVGRIFGLMNDVQPSDAALIDFTRQRYVEAGALEQAIRDRFGLGAIGFWQRVTHILDDPARIAALPPNLWPQVLLLDERRARAAGQRRRLAG